MLGDWLFVRILIFNIMCCTEPSTQKHPLAAMHIVSVSTVTEKLLSKLFRPAQTITSSNS